MTRQRSTQARTPGFELQPTGAETRFSPHGGAIVAMLLSVASGGLGLDWALNPAGDGGPAAASVLLGVAALVASGLLALPLLVSYVRHRRQGRRPRADSGP